MDTRFYDDQCPSHKKQLGVNAETFAQGINVATGKLALTTENSRHQGFGAQLGQIRHTQSMLLHQGAKNCNATIKFIDSLVELLNPPDSVSQRSMVTDRTSISPG